jgi:hypothetical protein
MLRPDCLAKQPVLVLLDVGWLGSCAGAEHPRDVEGLGPGKLEVACDDLTDMRLERDAEESRPRFRPAAHVASEQTFGHGIENGHGELLARTHTTVNAVAGREV